MFFSHPMPPCLLPVAFFLFLVHIHLLPGYALPLCTDWYRASDDCLSRIKQAPSDSSVRLCSEAIQKVKRPKKALEELLRAAYCVKTLAPTHLIDSLHSALTPKLVHKADWFRKRIKDYRLQSEWESALELAYLAELRHPLNKQLRKELEALYVSTNAFFLTGLSILYQTDPDITKNWQSKLSLDDVLKKARSEAPAEQILDSLIHLFPHHTEATLHVLSQLSWEHHHLQGVYSCLKMWINHHNIHWPKLRTQLNRLTREGHYGIASRLLEYFSWRALPSKEKKEALQLFFTLNIMEQNWSNVIVEFQRENCWDILNWNNRWGVAQAFTRSQPVNSETLTQHRTLAKKFATQLSKSAEPATRYKAKLLFVELLIESGDLTTASNLLQEEKNNPERTQGSGKILFWQGIICFLQFRFAQSDSLWMLSSAYSDESTAFRANQLRYYLMLDSNSTNRKAFASVLPEASHALLDKEKKIKEIPPESPLLPFAYFELSISHAESGNRMSAMRQCKKIEDLKTSPVWLKAWSKTFHLFLQENSFKKPELVEKYDQILIEYKNGVNAEFIRERINQQLSPVTP